MTAPPFTPVLLHGPFSAARQWGRLPGELAERGSPPLVAEVPAGERPPYAARHVAAAALEIARAAPAPPLLLVAAGSAGPLVPGIGAAQRAAHRHVAGYVLVDALLPQPGTPTYTELLAAQVPDLPGLPEGPEGPAAGASGPSEVLSEPLPLVQDWPDAPCGYLLTDPALAPCARLAGLRGWPVADTTRPDAPTPTAAALLDLVERL